MLRAGFLSFVVLSLAGVPVCLADVSLILPGFDPQPLSVDIIGVGADGETTYQLFPGQPTGTWVGQDPAFSGIATLVEGANNMIMEYADLEYSETVVESCTFANGVADCVGILLGQATQTIEEPATPILVQGGGTASPGPTGATGSAVSAQTAAPGSSVPGVSAATQSAPSPSTTPTKSASSGVRVTPARAALAGTLVILVVLT